MKKYQLKCEKWYSQTMAIFSEGIRTGTLVPSLISSTVRITLNGKEYFTRKKNPFGNSFTVLNGISKMAEVNCRSFSNSCVINTNDGKRYFLNSNFLGNYYELLGQEGRLGECTQRTFSTSFSFDDQADGSLVVAVMAHTHRVYQTAILVACFVPIFVVLISSIN